MKTESPSLFVPKAIACVLLGSILLSQADGLIQSEKTGKSKPSLSEKAQALIHAARGKIAKANAAENQKDQEYFFREAQAQLKQAHELLEQDLKQKKAAYDAFPKFIPKEDDDYVNRQEAEIAYMKAELELATCTYTEAKAHPAGSQDSSERLGKAAREFQMIHQKYRSMLAGLYARAWQGKCLEEQGEIGKALGIYNELLAHPGRSNTLQNLQDQTRLFRFQCLNSDSRKDYILVINEAKEWLSSQDKKESDPILLGIQFQKARAHEQLADQLEQKTPPPQAEIKQHRETALQEAKRVGKHPSQDQDAAKAMIKRLKEKLGL